MSRIFAAVCLMVAVLCVEAQAQTLIVFTQGVSVKVLSSDGKPLLELSPSVWGPNWKWSGLSGEFKPMDQGVRATFTGKMGGTDVPMNCTVTVSPDGVRQMKVDVTFSVSQDTDLTGVVFAVRLGEMLRGEGRATIHDASGEKTVNTPFGRGTLSPALRRLELRDAAGKTFALAFAEPTDVGQDGEARIMLASRHLAAGEEKRVSLTVELPDDAAVHLTTGDVPMPDNWDQWFEWKGTGGAGASTDDAPGAIDMSRWLDAPAGKHGRVTRRGGQLIYNDKPIRFWGVNCCFGHCAASHELAERQAKFYARYGINSVRFHKFADGPGWSGALSKNSFAEYDPKSLDNMDYLVHQFKQRGIYTELSANFGRVRIGSDDAAKIPFADQFKAGRDGWRDTSQGALWFSTELQDLQIAQIVNLLNHTNPYSNMRYADDPALFCIEIVNENSIYFYTTLKALQQAPAIKQRAGQAFFTWLKNKYGDEKSLLAAWGPGSIGCFGSEQMGDEGWDKGEIYPVGNPWFFDPDHLDKEMKPRKQRLLDTLRFMYDQQNAFYDRFVQAVRAAGYPGEILGSNWQAGRAFSHFLNLHSDYRVGIIDRHNYFGGTASMLADPGDGMLSSGMEQVADRPFMLSEWISTFPNEFAIEGPAILGAYGMGLNGWDASHIFQNGDDGQFRRELKETWDVVVPQIIGVFPAVARQVHRGDVKESQFTFTRNVHVPSLFDGKIGFDDRIRQSHDVKQFSSDTLPVATLAIGKGVVAFTPADEPTTAVQLTDYIHDGLVRSADGRLAWQAGRSPRDGYITINTPGTQAVVGFTDGKTFDLNDVIITSRTPFAAIYVTALDADASAAIASDPHVLITAIGRVRNTGMKMIAGNLIERGGPPLLVEPVRLELTLKRAGSPTIHVLDHDGKRTGQTLAPVDGKITLDSAQTHAIYYELDYTPAP
ncbi:MAG: hypothetical protein WC058_10565 [Phycisphaeraceae bacterium]